MPEEKNKKQEFLDNFTEEIILNTVKDLKARKKFEQDLKRARHAIEVEKLKMKFESYGEKPEKEAEKKNFEEIKKEVISEAKPAEPERKILLPAPLPQPQKVEQPRAPPAAPAKPAVIKPERKPEQLPITKIALPPRAPPAAQGEIDFGKILPLVRDPAVTYIECPGVEKNVIIKRAGITTKTQITLTRDEILAIIKSFSEKARIPLIEGMLNARVENLEISAVVTETGTPSFIIKRIFVEMAPARPSMLQGPILPQPGLRPAFPGSMPPVTRPFTPGAIPAGTRPQAQKEESFFNRKIKIA